LSPFDAGTFVDAYILLPIFGIIYVGYKFWFRTRFWRSDEIDLDSGMRKDLDAKDENMEEPHAGPQGKQSFLKNAWRKF
jgi:amino acid transporter